MSEEIKNAGIALSDNELEDVNGGVGIQNYLKDEEGNQMDPKVRFKFSNNVREEAELRSNSRTPI